MTATKPSVCPDGFLPEPTMVLPSAETPSTKLNKLPPGRPPSGVKETAGASPDAVRLRMKRLVTGRNDLNDDGEHACTGSTLPECEPLPAPNIPRKSLRTQARS